MTYPASNPHGQKQRDLETFWSELRQGIDQVHYTCCNSYLVNVLSTFLTCCLLLDIYKVHHTLVLQIPLVAHCILHTLNISLIRRLSLLFLLQINVLQVYNKENINRQRYMQLYSCAYDYCANVTGDPNAKQSDLPKPSRKPMKSGNGKTGMCCQ